MRVLLDTHTLLWVADDSPQLSIAARKALLPQTTERYFSVISLWEISIKVGLGKLPLRQPLESFLDALESNPNLLPLNLARDHFVRYAALPLHHRDPFDRMLVAQALSESLTVVGCDEAFDAYGVQRVW
ncbi:MAG: type II toxin-antitoxin system VapC family toxin [Terrimicrobiaceae bacterium]